MSIIPNPESFAPASSDLLIGGAGSARNLDKFYTKSDIARQCVDDFERWTGINLATATTDILEPSAGAGAFLDTLPSRTLAYDLLPEDTRIAAQDFLKLDRLQPAIVIGNPPFGKACRLAVQFFNHAATFASQIGFIVPRTFEKASIQNVRLRREPSDFVYDPMISPTLCQISFTALKSKFSQRPMAFAVGNGPMRTSSGSSRKVLSATGK